MYNKNSLGNILSLANFIDNGCIVSIVAILISERLVISKLSFIIFFIISTVFIKTPPNNLDSIKK